MIPWSPLARGLLAGALTPATVGRRADHDLQQEIQKHRPQLEAFERLCQHLGERPADVAMAWMLHQPAVTAVLAGIRRPDQALANAPAADVRLDAATLAELDAATAEVKRLLGPNPDLWQSGAASRYR